MKGDPRVIATLNSLLASEHAAIIQYTTHASMCENWGYKKLAAYILNRAKAEMKHAGMLMDRILFLEGTPTLINVGAVEIAEADGGVGAMFLLDEKAEADAIAGYTEGIGVAWECKDFATKTLLAHILNEENDHINEIEANITQIKQMGIGSYLPEQIEE